MPDADHPRRRHLAPGRLNLDGHFAETDRCAGGGQGEGRCRTRRSVRTGSLAVPRKSSPTAPIPSVPVPDRASAYAEPFKMSLAPPKPGKPLTARE